MGAFETYSAAIEALPRWRNLRVRQGEILDALPAEQAVENLRDMERINRLFGGFAILRGAIRELAGNARSLRILDVAAGAGFAARWLESQFPGACVTASDLRPDLLTLGNGPRCAADALALPFPANTFDLVVCTFFLHHLEEDTLPPTLQEMLRVSRLGVVAVDLVRHPLAYRFLHWSHPLFRWNWITLVDGPRSVQSAFTQAELQALLRRSGFSQASARMHRPWFRLSVTIPKKCGSRQPPNSVLSSGL